MNRLLIRPGAIGDCILSFPALEYQKADYTEVWIPSALAPLVQFADTVRPLAACGIDLLGVGDLEVPAPLRERLARFDEIVSWYGFKRPEFRAALEDINPRCVFHAALPDGRVHAVDFFARQVGAPDGLCPRLRFSPVSVRREAVVIHPFSGGRAKNWPLDRFRGLADGLAEQMPCAVEWIAGPEEQLEGALRFESLRDLAEHVSGARLYIGNDSGITHLAAASGVSTLALFGPTEPEIWAPRGENVTVLREEPLENLPVRVVLSAASRLLGSSP
ncbi:MAG TPA: glycosyltransferase family 9 protein [Bryobacteraceae bacterium]|nr:glycosyltransferase family 9 protein [Bryobacteraceae bacterium]